MFTFLLNAFMSSIYLVITSYISIKYQLPSWAWFFITLAALYVIVDILSKSFRQLLQESLYPLGEETPDDDEWTPCSVALPEPYDDVLVEVATYPGRAYCRHLCINDNGVWEDEWGHLFDGKDQESTVLSWRPVPEGPVIKDSAA